MTTAERRGYDRALDELAACGDRIAAGCVTLPDAGPPVPRGQVAAQSARLLRDIAHELRRAARHRA